jgi:hypothetical protein
MGLSTGAALPNEGHLNPAGARLKPVSVALFFHDSDADCGWQLATLLTGAGLAVRAAPATATDTDAVIVLLSAAALGSLAWTAHVTESVETATRLLPVRIGNIDPERVPQRLAALNWIDWQSANAEATFGYVLAGLFSDPGRRDLSRQLMHEAEAWARSGRSDALLIADYQRARRMKAMLSDLEADPLSTPTADMRPFVDRSVKVARPRYRRRRMRLVAGIAGVMAALLVAAAAVPAIKLASFNNKESVVTTGDPAMLRDLPEWSAANAAALLIDGTPAERALARVTLLRAMDEPWEVDALQWSLPPNCSVPFDHGRLAVISDGLNITVINVNTQRAVWTAVEPDGPYYLSVDPAGRVALGLSLDGKGAIVINLDRYAVRRIAVNTTFSSPSQDGSYGVLGNNGVALVRLPGQRLGRLSIATGAVTDLGIYPQLLSLSGETPRGTPSALVWRGSGRVDLLAVPSRRVLASLRGTPEAEAAGAISPDGREAIAVGGGQFWKIGAGQPATPTGIPVPRMLSSVTWAPGQRVVVVSDDQRGQVYYLPRAEPLGTICTQDTRLLLVISDSSSPVVACESEGGTTFWRLPPGPLPHRAPGESSASSWTSGKVTVTRSGSEIDIRGPGVNSGMFVPLSGSIQAVDVADNGQRVIVGDVFGEVAVIDVEHGYTAVVVAWADPDHSPIMAVGWDSGPVATTYSGQTWRVADCAECGTDAGLLRAYRARYSGCFTPRQLQYMASATWHALGLRECTAERGIPAPLARTEVTGS